MSERCWERQESHFKQTYGLLPLQKARPEQTDSHNPSVPGGWHLSWHMAQPLLPPPRWSHTSARAVRSSAKCPRRERPQVARGHEPRVLQGLRSQQCRPCPAQEGWNVDAGQLAPSATKQTKGLPMRQEEGWEMDGSLRTGRAARSHRALQSAGPFPAPRLPSPRRSKRHTSHSQ